MTYEPDQVIGGENATEATEAAGVTEATEAVHTDAVRGGIQTAAAGLPDARRYRPLVGGIGIGPDTSVAGGPVGTLGMIVADPGTGKRMGLTNHHIFYGGGPFSQVDVVQPAWGELAPGFIGSLIRSVFSAEADAAAIEIDPRIPVSCQVQDLGLLGGSVEPVKGMKVRKRGRSTYWTYGVIDNVDQECHITLPNGKRHTFQHQFMVVCDPPDAGSAFADDGDSGAVVVTEDAQVVGLLLGTHTDDNGVTRGVATKFGTVMDKLGVAMAYEGIGNWDMAGPGDRGFAFDRDGKGHPDHLVFYRPGQGAAFVIARNGGGFRPLYRQGKNGSGIGGFDLDSGLDRAFAFEYNFDPTKTYTILDHIAIYRPGSGQFWILGKKTGQDGKLDFERVFPPNPTVKDPPHDGIAGFTFKDEADRAFAYDYYGTGHLSQLALYRPGQKMFWIVGRGGPNFQRAFPDPGAKDPSRDGIGGYPLNDSADRAFAYNPTATKAQDHIVLYRPGKKMCWIVRPKKQPDGHLASPPAFERVFPDPALHDPKPEGVGGYPLDSDADRVFAFDYDSSGHADHIVLYRPKAKKFWIVGPKKQGGVLLNPLAFQRVYPDPAVKDPEDKGIAGYDFSEATDRAFAYDYLNTGKMDHLVLYRPEWSTCWIIGRKRVDGVLTAEWEVVYQGWKTVPNGKSIP